MTFEEWCEKERPSWNDECLFDTQEEHDRYELEQAIMSCWGITDDLHLLADAMDDSRTHEEMLKSIITLYELKFQKLFKEFEKFMGCC